MVTFELKCIAISQNVVFRSLFSFYLIFENKTFAATYQPCLIYLSVVGAKNFIREMGGWNPYDKKKPPSSNIVEKWGKINYLSDPLHHHKGYVNLCKID